MDVKRTFLDSRRREGPARAVPEARPRLQDPRLLRQAQHRARRPAALPGAARGLALPEGRPALHRLDRADGAAPTTTGRPAAGRATPSSTCMIPTLIDPTMTPPGKHFMSVFVQYARRRRRRGPRDWTDADRDAFGDTCLDQIEAYAPGFRDLVLHAEVRTPARARGRGRPDRGQHLPGRADLRPAPVQPPGPRLRPVPLADRGPLDVRLLDPPRRRRHGRPRPQRRRRDPARRPQARPRHERSLCRPLTPSSSAAAPTASPPPAASPSAGRSVLLLEAGATRRRRRADRRVRPRLPRQRRRPPAEPARPARRGRPRPRPPRPRLLGRQPRHHRALGDRRPPAPRRRLRRDACGAIARQRRLGDAARPAAALRRRAEAVQGADPAAARQGRRQRDREARDARPEAARHGPRRPARVPARPAHQRRRRARRRADRRPAEGRPRPRRRARRLDGPALAELADAAAATASPARPPATPPASRCRRAAWAPSPRRWRRPSPRRASPSAPAPASPRSRSPTTR